MRIPQTRLFRWMGHLGAATVVVIADYLLVLTDCVIAGRVLGEYALGAMNLLMPVFSVVTFFLWLVVSGVFSVYSKFVGRKDTARASRFACTGLVASVLTGVLLTVVLTALEEPYLIFMQPGEEITAYSGAFWRWYMPAVLLESLELFLFYLVYAHGGSRTCIFSYALQTTANLMASYWLCERYGMAGISAGSVIAYVVGIAALLPRFLARTDRIPMAFGLEPVVLVRSFRTSFGDAFVWLFHALLFLTITKCVLEVGGSGSLAINAVVFCIIRLTAFFGGIGIVLRAVKGEGQFFKVASSLAFMAMAFSAVAFAVAPEPLVGLFGIVNSELAEDANMAARITVGALALSVAVAFLPLLRRARQAAVPQAPLNYLQQYVLLRMAESPGSQMFNLVKLFRLRKGVDLERLSAALVTSARAHAAILTVVRRDVDGEAVQRQELPPAAVECPVVRADERELLAGKERLVTVFGGFGGKLLNARIFDCGDVAYLLSDFHHLICDGYSFPLILDGARKVYEGGVVEPDAYYAVLAKREEKSASSVAAATRGYLKEHLKDPKFVTLPPPDFGGEPSFGSYETALELPAGFAEFLAERRVTRHHVFLTATVLALARLAKANDVLVDWVFHGRVSKDELRTVGAFMVDLPLDVEDVGDLTPGDVLARVKLATFKGIRSVNSFRSVEDVNPDGRDRLTFIYQDEWGELMTAGPVREDGPYGWMIDETIPLVPPAARPENPFNVEIMEHREATRLFLEYDSGRYAEATVRRYAELFQAALAEIVRG